MESSCRPYNAMQCNAIRCRVKLFALFWIPISAPQLKSGSTQQRHGLDEALVCKEVVEVTNKIEIREGEREDMSNEWWVFFPGAKIADSTRLSSTQPSVKFVGARYVIYAHGGQEKNQNQNQSGRERERRMTCTRCTRVLNSFLALVQLS